ncbi:DUF192 domain-containing protein [Candidatus Gracilibacteria bacterium]|nr:DUF192 domain-containing protein [Candidatus Gracilibacteria bacterium]
MKKVFMLICFTLFLWGCEQNLEDLKKVEIGGETFLVEVVDTPQERRDGLMFRKSMPLDKGMLFIFEAETLKTFWMKNTLLPLKIIWISEEGIVVDIQNAEPCRANPCKTYRGKSNAKMVLEVNQSVLETLEIGDMIKIGK